MPSYSIVLLVLSRVDKMGNVIKEMLGSSVRTEYANARASLDERSLLRH
jgi:hypothetical protein